jgi:hypothetical protein
MTDIKEKLEAAITRRHYTWHPATLRRRQERGASNEEILR